MRHQHHQVIRRSVPWKPMSHVSPERRLWCVRFVSRGVLSLIDPAMESMGFDRLG